MSNAFSDKTRNDPNRHAGVSNMDCSCGLIHDNELRTDAEARKEIIRLLGSKCSNPNCRWLNLDGSLGCTDERLLQVDHVDDDGYLDRKKLGRSCRWVRVLDRIRKGSRKYQLLCACCNWLKRYEAGSWSIEFSSWLSKNRMR